MLVTVAVLFFLAVFKLIFALVLPVELLVDVLGGGSDRQGRLGFLNYLVEDLFVLNALQFRVHAEILGNNLVSNLGERFNFTAWEGLSVVAARLHDLLGDLSVFQVLSHTLIFELGVLLHDFLGRDSRSVHSCCQTHL